MTSVSIVMSVYNAQDTIGYCIESVLKQTFEDFEFIIINDGSWDNTSNILTRYSKLDDRLRIYERKRAGLTKSLIYGISKAKGKFIARIDGDDTWLTNKLELQLEMLSKSNDIKICGTFEKIVDLERKSSTMRALPETHNEIVKRYFVENPFVHSSVVFELEAYERVGGYNENYVFAQDYKLWCDMLTYFEGVNIPLPLTVRSVSQNTISRKRQFEQRVFALRARVGLLRMHGLNFNLLLQILKDLIRTFYYGIRKLM